MSESVEIEGVRLFLAQPDHSPGEWIGQQEILKQLLACWLTVDKADLPLAPRLVGQPGIGKTTLGMAAARARQRWWSPAVIAVLSGSYTPAMRSNIVRTCPASSVPAPSRGRAAMVVSI